MTAGENAMTQAGTVLLIGGSGFVGSAVAARLVADGWRVRVATRRVANARHLMPLPTLDVVEANVHDDAALHALTAGVDAVVSLVGVLHSPPGTPYGPAFARAHVDLPTRLAAAFCEASRTDESSSTSKSPSRTRLPRRIWTWAILPGSAAATSIVR